MWHPCKSYALGYNLRGKIRGVYRQNPTLALENATRGILSLNATAQRQSAFALKGWRPNILTSFADISQLFCEGRIKRIKYDKRKGTKYDKRRIVSVRWFTTVAALRRKTNFSNL